MKFEEALRRLVLFEIPAGNSHEAESVRTVLARLVANGLLSVGELQIARDIVERANSDKPAAYVFLAAMFVSLHVGNTLFNPDRAENIGGRLLQWIVEDDAENDDSVKAAQKQHNNTIEELWPAALDASEGLKGDAVTCDANGHWYFTLYAKAVEDVRKMIARRISTGEDPDKFDVSRYISYESGDPDSPFQFENEQIQAVRTVLARKFAVITGGPGTGKTTIVCSILRAVFDRYGFTASDVALIAPTGRAAQRMGEALRNQYAKSVANDVADKVFKGIPTLTGHTIHSLLGGRAPNWTYNETNRLPHKLIVVDECSMVDLLLMRSLLLALRDDCRLVLLGDKNQLPSVDAGAVLGDLMEWGRNDGEDSKSFVDLIKARRFKGLLRDCADEFNNGCANLITGESCRLPTTPEGAWTKVFSPYDNRTEDMCYWHTLQGENVPQQVDSFVKEWAQLFGLYGKGKLATAAEAITADDPALEGIFDREDASGNKSNAAVLFDILDQSRILAVVRKGPLGVQHINELLLNARLGRVPTQPLIEAGIPVIIKENTPSLDLFNGDVGVTVKTSDGVSVLFLRGDKTVNCPVSMLPEHELAYAMTVHKSQGSEFGNVAVILPSDERHPLLNRQIVYTGITRAKKRAVIVGTKTVLEVALKQKLERDTGIA